MLEPDEGKPSRPVLRGLGVSNGARLLDMYGPPQSCKRKTKNGSWSAPMYSAFRGVSDSGP